MGKEDQQDTGGMKIAITEELHQVTFRQVASPSEITVCCDEFAEEYGKLFTLARDGGLVPAVACMQRTKLGKTVLDKPKIGWRYCHYCGKPIVSVTTPVNKILTA
jgi:hypothetical protein